MHQFLTHILNGPHLLPHRPNRTSPQSEKTAWCQHQLPRRKDAQHWVERAHHPHLPPNTLNRLFGRLMYPLHQVRGKRATKTRQQKQQVKTQNRLSK
jgi:hypothetical protein